MVTRSILVCRKKTLTGVIAWFTYVNVKLLGTTERKQDVGEDVDVVLVQQGRVVLNSKTGIPEKQKKKKRKKSSTNGQFSNRSSSNMSMVHDWSNNSSRSSYLMVVMQPPRRIKLGCSVKQTIFESGDNLFSSLVNKRERPRGSYCREQDAMASKSQSHN